jgi:SAM-dependent methyltransferase
VTRIGLREQYEIERELAGRLLKAPRDQRRAGLYNAVYDELFARAPRHLRVNQTLVVEKDEQVTAAQVRLVRHFLGPDSVFLEIGPGDYRVVRAVAPLVSKVYAVDVSHERAAKAELPDNTSVSISDGVSVEVPPGAIDLAYSNQVMEHLHPEDAYDQLREIYAALKPGGRYLCITPNPLSGPHDVSRHFGSVASALHLKEYLLRELVDAMKASGFLRVQVVLSHRGRLLTPLLPARTACIVETMIEALPVSMRRTFAPSLSAAKVLATR